MEFETLAIHAGQEPDPSNGAVMTPIYQTSTYVQDGVGRARQGYEYSRTKNPTRVALENCLALGGGAFCLAFASGMAPHSAASADSGTSWWLETMYGAFRLFDKILRRYGLSFFRRYNRSESGCGARPGRSCG
jgi:cystathionine beta-lyase/cystathionine gamma-synthase